LSAFKAAGSRQPLGNPPAAPSRAGSSDVYLQINYHIKPLYSKMGE
jgi:hypothetical protein